MIRWGFDWRHEGHFIIGDFLGLIIRTHWKRQDQENPPATRGMEIHQISPPGHGVSRFKVQCYLPSKARSMLVRPFVECKPPI